MYSKIFKRTVSLSRVAFAVEMIMIPAFSTLPEALEDLIAFEKDMEDISFCI